MNFNQAKLAFEDAEFDLTGAPVAIVLYILTSCKSGYSVYVNYWLCSGRLVNTTAGLEDMIQSLTTAALHQLNKFKAERTMAASAPTPIESNSKRAVQAPTTDENDQAKRPKTGKEEKRN
jgi:hypothetical protein